MANTAYIAPINNNDDNDNDIICNICLDNIYKIDADNGIHIKCNCKRGFICNNCIIPSINKCPICRQDIINPLELDNNIDDILNMSNGIVFVNTISICIYLKTFISLLLLLFINVFMLGYILFLIHFNKGQISNIYEFKWIMGWGFMLFLILLIFIEILSGRYRNNYR